MGANEGGSRLTIRMTDEMREGLEALANAQDMSVSSLSRQMLELALGNDESKVSSSVERLMEAEAVLAEAKARHMHAQARRVELENERIESGMPVPGEGMGLNLVVVGDARESGMLQAVLPRFGSDPGQIPYRELPGAL